MFKISDEEEIIKVINGILDKNKNQIDEYLSGKDKVLGFFVGQVMKETKGKANPQMVNQILKSELEKYRK